MREGMTILVAYDGSAQSQHALSEAALIAGKFSGSITVLNVLTPSNEKGKIREQNIRNELESSMKVFGGGYEVMFKDGSDVAGTILKTAAEGEFELIAVGQRGASSLKTMLMGSVSRRVVSEARCDVLVTK